VVDKAEPPWTKPPVAGLSAAEWADFGAAQAALDARLAEAATAGREGAASGHLLPDCAWNPALNAVSSWYNGAELDRISVLDYAAYADDEVNWRVPDGYGALISAYGEGVPVRLESPVSAIDRSGAQLRLDPGGGELLAEAVVVAVPSAVLAEARLKIRPALPEVVEACAGLPLGLANKVFLALDQPASFPVEGGLFGRADTRETGSYHLRPFGRPVIEVFLGGRWAAQLEGEGSGAATAFAIEELSAVFGSSFGRKVRPLAETAWGADPWSLGSYSHALPGQAGGRALLRELIEDRIVFAGEHCSTDAFSTAHGAYRSGIEAAERLLMVQGRLRPAEPA
jgi:monoamine oxidase